MIPVRAVRPTKLQAINTPAVVLPVENYGEPFFVFGEGENAIACFIGGNHTFETMSAAENTNWDGLAIEGVEIEVDLDSAYSLDGSLAHLGSVIRTGSRLELVARAPDGQGFKRSMRFVLEDDLAPASEGMQIGFKRWALVLREGDRLLFDRVIEAGDYER